MPTLRGSPARPPERLRQPRDLLDVEKVSCYYGYRPPPGTRWCVTSRSVSATRRSSASSGSAGAASPRCCAPSPACSTMSTGTIAFRGEPLARSAVKRPRAIRRQVQIVFQDPASSLNPRHTVGQIIARAVSLFREDVPREQHRRGRRRAPREREALSRLRRPLPVRAERRPAAARGHRACVRRAAQPAALRRGHVRAGRLRRRHHPRAAARSHQQVGHGGAVRQSRPRRRAHRGRPRHRDARRPAV